MALPTRGFAAHPGSEHMFSSGCGASGFRWWLSSKVSTCIAGDIGDAGSIPGSERSLGGGNGNPLQYSCLGNPVGRGTWRATVHGVTKSRTQLTRLSMHAHGASRLTDLLLGSLSADKTEFGDFHGLGRFKKLFFPSSKNCFSPLTSCSRMCRSICAHDLI